MTTPYNPLPHGLLAAHIQFRSMCASVSRIVYFIVVSLIFNVYSIGKEMDNNDIELTLVPVRASINDMTVTAQVKLVENQWDVVVIFSRPNEQPPMNAADVKVKLLVSDGEALQLIEAPDGFLPAFGDGLGETVNARYRFKNQSSPPAILVVRHGTKEITFKLLPGYT